MKKAALLQLFLLLASGILQAQYFDKITGQAPANNFAKAYSASWGDYNNDGLDDLIQTDNNKHNVLYKNMGNGVFQMDTVNPIYTTSSVNSMATCWGDYNNDGFLDLLIVNTSGSGAANHHNCLFKNEGNGQWTLVTSSPLYTDHGWGLGATMVDYDNDGNLDIYIVNNDTVNFLYHNNGDETFSRIYTSAGPLVTDIAKHYTAVWADYDNDGWQDCFVVNYFSTLPGEPDALYHNNHDGTFTKTPGLNLNTDNWTDQGASWGDYDNDGYLDLFITMYAGLGFGDHNVLYHNNGNGTFTQATSSQPSIDANQSFGSAWLDFNNDGKLDLVVANNKSTNRHNFLYRNEGNGVFTNITTDPVVVDVLRSMGVSISDYDNNGYPDIYIDSWSSTQEPGMYRNKGGTNNWIALKLIGTTSNRSAIGARLTLWRNGSKQIREIAGGTGFYCSGSLTQNFGIGAATEVDSLVINWPSGLKQVLCQLAINTKTTVTEGVQYSGTDILTFTLPEQVSPAVIDTANHTVHCVVATGTSLSALTPVITVSQGAILYPTSGTTVDFSSGPVIYAVTSATCLKQNWSVTVTAAPVVPENLQIQNTTVVNGQVNCYNALQTITIAGGGTTFTVATGGGATLIAGHSVVLLPGTKVLSGGYLWAYITTNSTYCPTPSVPFTANSENETTETESSQKLNLSSGVRIYPNPAGESFTIDLTGIENGQNVTVKITEVSGATVSEGEYSGGLKYSHSLQNIRPGIYFVRIESGNVVTVLKLIRL